MKTYLGIFLFAVVYLMGSAQCFAPISILPKSQKIVSSSSSTTTKLWNLMDAGDLENSQTTDDSLLLPWQMDRRSALFQAIVAGSFLSTIHPEVSYAAMDGSSSSIPEWTLEGGVKMPILALNTVGLSAEETERAVRLAKKEGITHVDFHPGKERDGVAQYIAKEGTRDGLFLNTKIRKAPPGTSPSDAAERTRSQIEEDFKVLGVDSVDMLMLRDSPDCGVIQAQWAVLEDALAAGKTRSIGVINFCQSALTCVLQTAKVKPALNYYMLHVGMGSDAHGLRTFGESKGIRTFAYGAVGEPGPSQELLTNPLLKQMGDAHGKSPEEIALRWVTQSGAAVSVRPTTQFGLGTSQCNGPLCEDGIKARANSFTWSLSKKEMKQLNAMTSPDDNPTLFSSSGCPNAFVMPK